MTERNRPAVERDPERLTIGPSALRWDGEALNVDLSERAAPIPRRVHGRVRLYPSVVNAQPIELDPHGRHRWTPVSPAARVEVALEAPRLTWSGTGYLDHNTGREPLERRFDNWFWSRGATREGPVVLYETQLRSGDRRSLTLHFDHDGRRHELATPPVVGLPRTRWGIDRLTRSDDGEARVQATWEDTPFYARSLVRTRLLGERVDAVHESLSLRRFSTPWVQLMLPFRMPRRRR